MTTREKVLAQLKEKSPSSWQDVKNALHYSEYPNMMKVVRSLERDGELYRRVGKDADGNHTLDILTGLRPIHLADSRRLEGSS